MQGRVNLFSTAHQHTKGHLW